MARPSYFQVHYPDGSSVFRVNVEHVDPSGDPADEEAKGDRNAQALRDAFAAAEACADEPAEETTSHVRFGLLMLSILATSAACVGLAGWFLYRWLVG